MVVTGCCAPASCGDGNSCTDDVCDAVLGCTHVANTAPCNDGNPCTGPDVCGGGSCQPGPNPCNDNNACTVDVCDGAGGCAHAPDDCDDRNADVRLAPVEVAGVALSKIAGGTRIAWTSQDASAGPATVYDLVTGVLADLRGSRDFTAAWWLAGGVADTPYDDLSGDPPEGSGRYVSARARQLTS